MVRQIISNRLKKQRETHMIHYKLLTPGPLTTSKTVKEEMMVDHCTWDNDYKQITQEIRKELLALAHVSEKEYTCVLMQGSGTQVWSPPLPALSVKTGRF